MNDEYYRKANLINCDPLYKSKVQFMSLSEMKKLHREHGLSDDIKINQDTIISTLKLVRTLELSEDEYDKLCEEFNIWFAESGCDREYHTDSDVEQMSHNYVTEKVGTDDWVIS